MVVGAHLTGMPLNHELTGPGGKLVKTCRTAGDYRLFVLPNTTPPKPGLIREPGFAGKGLEVEVWKVTPAAFGASSRTSRTARHRQGHTRRRVPSVRLPLRTLCHQGAQEVTDLGGWRAYIASRK